MPSPRLQAALISKPPEFRTVHSIAAPYLCADAQPCAHRFLLAAHTLRDPAICRRLNLRVSAPVAKAERYSTSAASRSSFKSRNLRQMCDHPTPLDPSPPDRLLEIVSAPSILFATATCAK
jgi:hypothetical protein